MTEISACPLALPPDFSGVAVARLEPFPPLPDDRAAMALAASRPGACMLLSGFHRDRDCESPRHADECHLGSATPGYVDYGLHPGATLNVEVEGSVSSSSVGPLVAE